MSMNITLSREDVVRLCERVEGAQTRAYAVKYKGFSRLMRASSKAMFQRFRVLVLQTFVHDLQHGMLPENRRLLHAVRHILE